VTKTIVVFATIAASVIAFILWVQHPPPIRLILKRDVIGCADLGYLGMIVSSLSDDTVLSPSDEAILSMMHNGECKTLTSGTVVTIKEKRDRTEKMPPIACVQRATEFVGCTWIIATTKNAALAQ